MDTNYLIVKHNYWKSIDISLIDDYVPNISVSIVIPHYMHHDKLLYTISCLEQQTYPKNLFEVIIVDDGSSPPFVMPYESELDIKIIWQEDIGFRLSKARNMGVSESKYDIILFLDSDILVEKNWIFSHLKWHSLGINVFTVGIREHISNDIIPEYITNKKETLYNLLNPQIRLHDRYLFLYYSRNEYLYTKSTDIFRVAIGAHYGISKYYYQLIGQNDESFTQWGGEDIEFAYRAYTQGLVFIPIYDSIGLHQGLDLESFAYKQKNKISLAPYIPDTNFRNINSRKIYVNPKFVIYIKYEYKYGYNILNIIEILLKDYVYDIMIIIDKNGCNICILDIFLENKRVFFTEGEDLNLFKFSEFYVIISADIELNYLYNNIIYNLFQAISNNALLNATVNNKIYIQVFRRWALNRSLNIGVDIEHIGMIIEKELIFNKKYNIINLILKKIFSFEYIYLFLSKYK